MPQCLLETRKGKENTWGIRNGSVSRHTRTLWAQFGHKTLSAICSYLILRALTTATRC
jgi:hypothetical protein